MYGLQEGERMQPRKIRRMLNLSAVALLLGYVVGIILMFVVFGTIRFDDDFVFSFAFRYLLWGGVSLLAGVLILMVAKTVLTKE